MEDELKPLVKIFRDCARKIKYNKKIERHDNTFITLKDDKNCTMYCSCCWDKEKELIQVDKLYGGRFQCPNCKQISCYNKQLADETSVIHTDNDIEEFVNYNDAIDRR